MTKEQIRVEAEVYNKSLKKHPSSEQSLTDVLVEFAERLQNLQQTHVMLSLPMFRMLFNELLSAGRDMRDRDRLGLYYLPEDEYFADVLKRYGADGNGA